MSNLTLDDRVFHDRRPSSVCFFCARLETGQHSCEAFPAGIPDDIWDGIDTHERPHPGDHGLQFTPLFEGAKPVAAAGERRQQP